MTWNGCAASVVQRLFCCFVTLVLLIGCQAFKRARWDAPLVVSQRIPLLDGCEDDSTAELAYEQALELEDLDDPACVDSYYTAATLAWPEVERQLALRGFADGRVADIYRSSLAKLITAGQRYRRLDPKSGLQIQTRHGCFTVPVQHRGFVWQPHDFDYLIPVGDYATRAVNHFYSCQGLGVATVAIHCRRPHETFQRTQGTFAATAVLRPKTEMGPAGFVLELIDALRHDRIPLAGRQVALDRDISAPLVYVLSQADQDYLARFIQPGLTSDNNGLFMVEPYQPGKIPIVFVHGLLSDPLTWANLANEILAQPDLQSRYQIWAFDYSTGEPFLESAALLRRQLRQLRAQIDPGYQDPALSQAVLVGHSMGGLVAKLQVTCSGNQVWQGASNRRFDSVTMAPEFRTVLADAFFFSPSPQVSRVVFIGTPHRGSPWARRTIGRIGSALVEEPRANESRHERLVRDNPNAFSEEFTRRIPTSIDLLRSDSPLLQAIERLPVAANMRLHSIIGSYRPMIGAGDSDGVVPVDSAQLAGVESERFVTANHGSLNKNQETIDELLRILRQHLASLNGHAQ